MFLIFSSIFFLQPPIQIVTEIPYKVVPVLFFTEHHAMKAYWGSRGIPPRILDIGTRWR
jgi:hypothetical protein